MLWKLCLQCFEAGAAGSKPSGRACGEAKKIKFRLRHGTIHYVHAPE